MKIIISNANNIIKLDSVVIFSDDVGRTDRYKSGEESSRSTSSSMSGSENTALLVGAKAKAKESDIVHSGDRSSNILKRRPAVRRHTTVDGR